MAGFVLATVAVRFVFPAVSAEGAAFWIVRASPVSLRDFLWSKFWTGLAPLLIFIEGLTIAANELMGVDPWLKALAIVAIAFMTVALVGLAVGFGARYPRFGADPTQAAGSLRRCLVHGPRRAVRHRDGCAARLAIVHVAVQPATRHQDVISAGASDDREPRNCRRAERRHSVDGDALGRRRARANASLALDRTQAIYFHRSSFMWRARGALDPPDRRRRASGST